MEFLQPSWIWGILAVAVPVAIHFWNQKKGKTIEWAASRWLLDKTTLNHRGIQLHEIPLMLLRCMLVILLALILAKPVLDWLNASSAKTIHLVQPNKLLIDNYRFELESASKKGEKMYWIGPETQEVTDIAQIPVTANSELYLQQSVNKIAGAGSEFKIYVVANQELAALPKTYLPGSFTLFTVIDSAGKKPSQLTFDKKINVLVSYKNADESKTIEAALKALADVFHIPFSVELKADQGKNYDWILTDDLRKPIDNQILYTVSGKVPDPALPAHVCQIPDSLKLSSSSIVGNGRLPEILGEAFIKHAGLNKNTEPLSNRQVRALFVKAKPVQDMEAVRLQKWLLLTFILATILERWISLRKTRVSPYA